MSDIERRLHDVLVSAAAEAPNADGLAAGARRRARGRRRALTAAAAAVAVAAIAVPSAWALGGDRPSTGPSIPGTAPPVTSPTGAPVPDGWRVETWRNLEIRVPDDWGYGHLSTWCAAGGSLDDRIIERPGGAVRPVACKAPQSGFGVQFFDPAAYDPAYAAGHVRRIVEHGPFPEGSWVGFQYAGVPATADAAVLVVAPSEQVARDVLGSARLVEDVDANGCRATDSPLATGDTAGASVCRYTADGWLEQSELLSPGETDQALQAVDAAPETAYAPPCPAPLDPPKPVSQYVVILAGATRMQVVWEGAPCADRGVFIDARERRELTEEVMYWALSPGWSGGVDAGVPLPAALRR